MKKKTIPVLILIPSLLLTLFGSTTLSSPSTRVYVNPSTIVATLAGNFTVDINVEDVTDLNAWGTWLIWDPQLLDIVKVTEGDFLKTGGDTMRMGAPSNLSIANEEGFIYVGYSLWDYSPAHQILPGVNGSGTLAEVTFHSVDLGGCVLDLLGAKLINSAPVTVPDPLGDTNGDLLVDIFDEVKVAGAYGHYVGYPRYDESADFNEDGYVDVFDILCVSMEYNFGKSYTDPGQTALEPVLISHQVNDGYATIYPGLIKEDLNGDDTVNMVDIATVGQAYGSRPGDSRWNSLCDLMKDNVTDYFDANMVARMFGWSAEDPVSPKPVEWKLNITIDHLVRGIESHTVTIFSDYIVYSNYTFDHLNAELIFDVTSSIDAFCNITIPRGLLNGAFRVELDDAAAPSILTWNGTHTCIYFASDQLSHRVKIVGLTPGDVTAVPGETQPIVDIYDVVFITTHFEDPLRYIEVYLGPHFY